MCRQNMMCVGMKRKTPKIPSGIPTWRLVGIIEESWIFTMKFEWSKHVWIKWLLDY
jgi:hypothetical protein